MSDRLAPFLLYERQDQPGTFELVLHDDDMEDVEDVFLAAGAEGNGHGWESLAEALVRRRMPEIGERLRFGSEAGTFVVVSDGPRPLRRLGAVLRDAFHDREALARLLRELPAGWAEDAGRP